MGWSLPAARLQRSLCRGHVLGLGLLVTHDDEVARRFAWVTGEIKALLFRFQRLKASTNQIVGCEVDWNMEPGDLPKFFGPRLA
jgi:hypothetical protein